MDIRNKKIKNVFKISRDAWRGKRTAFWVEIVWFSLVERWTVDGRGPSLCLPSFPWSPRACVPDLDWPSHGAIPILLRMVLSELSVFRCEQVVAAPWSVLPTKTDSLHSTRSEGDAFSLLSYARAHTVGGEKWTVVKISIILVKLVSFILLVGLNRAYCCCHYQLKLLCHGKIIFVG